jgi:hypothetical protein
MTTSQAEADCYKKQCNWYDVSMEALRSEVKHVQTAFTELHNIQLDMERSLTQTHEEITKLEQLDIQRNLQIPL